MILTTRYDDDEYRVYITAYKINIDFCASQIEDDNLILQLVHKAREERLSEDK